MTWGERGEPTIADAVNMLASAANVEEAAAWLSHLTNKVDGSGRANRAEFFEAEGSKS